MQSGVFTSSDAQVLTSRVVVEGVDRPHESWSVSRSLSGDLPAQVVAASGIQQATGTVVWAPSADVTERVATPWNKGGQWLPEQGNRVTIYVGDGTNEWIQFHGVIDELSGDVGSLPQSTIVDWTDYLNRKVSHEAVLRLHPPKSEGAAYMGVGMSAGYAVDRAMRACGFYATPRMEPGVVVSAPCQMSVWPEFGIVTAAGAITPTNTHAENHRASWGWCVGDFTATYTPQGTITPTDPVQLTARISVEHAGTFVLTGWYGSTKVELTVNSSRTAIAKLGTTTVATLAMESNYTIISLLVKSGTWTLKTNGGATTAGSATIPAGSNLTSVTVTGDADSRVAGIQVSKPPAGQELQSLGHVNSFYQETSLFAGLMDVLPAYVNRPADELLTEISKATLAPCWFDEKGAPRFIGSDVLRAQAPSQTVTTLDDIFALSWENNRLSMRSQVSVKYRYPVLNRSRYSNIWLWQGTGETMEDQQEKTLLAATPDDEDWAEVDLGAVATAGGLTAFNQGRGTWLQGYLEDSAGAWTAATGYYTVYPIDVVDYRTRLFRVETLVLPAGKKFVLATPDDATNYFPRFRGYSMPVLRGRARVRWIDKAVFSATTGPAGFPQLEHDAGPWAAQAANTVIQDRIADFIAEQVTQPAPTITGLRVAYDPRRQLGDVITIDSPKLLGVTITALIVGVENAGSDSFTQSLSVRIISATSDFTTYTEYNDSLPSAPLSYAEWQALGPVPETYVHFNDA